MIQTSPRRILLLGAAGQVGWELRRSLLPLGEVLPITRAQADLADLDRLDALLEREQPTLIVNAAAYTAVDRAESDTEQAYRINAEAPARLARHAAAHDAWLVHYSTDYVFDGTKDAPYTEADAPNPQSVYGQSKREGELAIAASGCRHIILRTSWVYAARGGNFAKTMLKLAAERDSLRVIADQFGAPTSAELIADMTALILARLQQDAALAARASGLYHLSAQGATSWHGYAQFVLAMAAERGMALRCAPEEVQAIASRDYPLPAPRPANSRLDCSKLQTTFDLHLPPWQAQVERLIDELIP